MSEAESVRWCDCALCQESGEPAPYGTCHCRCAGKTNVPTRTDSSTGYVKGVPMVFIQGHSSRRRGGKYATRSIGQEQINHGGYVQVYRPDHPHAPQNGWVMKHRLVMEEQLGRYLLPEEIVHHVRHESPEDRQDNRPSNLELEENQSAHRRRHIEEFWASGKWSRKHEKCVRCGTTAKRHASRGHCQDCYNELYWSGQWEVRQKHGRKQAG